ncbi:MAG: DNA polymerase III subunit alpha [Clostridia bacterium]|nr:DNA polymerase III subunit alpha [Clostridia bacterium]
MKGQFVHLHTHTEYSLLDGAARIKKLVQKAADLGMPALAITDHGVMYGVIDFYKAARKAGIKPILGCEVYVAPRTMQDREARVDDALYHLVLLAENGEGYRNLLELVSQGFTEGFYYKPRVDKALLRKHSKGLIALSACLAGEVASYILAQQPKKARESAEEYRQIFGEGNFYLELQDHRLEEQRQVNRELLKISRELGLPLVATNDIHYINREDAEVQDVLLCIQTGKTVDEEGRMKFSTEEFYLKDYEEMRLLFGEWPEALENTVKIAERCQVELDFSQTHLPYYEVPEGYDRDSYLEKICWEKAAQRYGELSPEVQERLGFELSVIKTMGYSGYFLIVWDFINYAREKGILVGPGRGSAAGSMVAYVLGITNIEPLRFNLLFERFLNPERVSMPDIDIDFCFERRGEVIDYVVQRYGVDKVCQIITFGTMAARAAIRDVGRALNFPYGEVDKVAKMVPTELGITIEKALAQSSDLRELYNKEPRIKKLIDMAAALEGMPRHAGTHAAGVVIAKEPLTHYLPLYKTSEGVISTQFAKDTVEEIGLLKMDLLGLRTLTVIRDAMENIRHTKGIDIDIDNIPLDNALTYQMLGMGDGIGVFQLESSGMRAIMKDLKPETIDDITALVAIYRPGPLGSGMVDDFIKGKHGGGVKYLHPKLEPILRDTYGVILYQEQVMRIASDLAGFTLGEADLLRRAMGKKKPEVIAGLRSQFAEGAVKNGVDSEIAGQIFDLMEYFAGYGFNKSHSAAYAMVSYQTAYLKANYPLEYMAALLTSIMDNSDKVAAYIEDCRKLGIQVLPPDVNESRESFTPVGDKIRFGLAAVKNVGHNAILAVIAARQKEGPFASLQDFCSRVDLKVMNKRVLESLIRCGAMDSLPGSRAQKMHMLDRCLDAAQQIQKDRDSGQVSFFDLFSDGPEAMVIPEIPLPDVPEFPQKELLAMEKEIVGLYISGHPLAEYRDLLNNLKVAATTQLKELKDGEQAVIGGLVAGIKRITTRRGEDMLFFNLEDLTGTVEVVMFPRVYQQYKWLIQADTPVLIKGKINHQDEDVKILADQLKHLNDVTEGYDQTVAGQDYPVEEKSGYAGVKQLFLKLEFSPQNQEQVAMVEDLLNRFPGRVPVMLCFRDEGVNENKAARQKVQVSNDLLAEIRSLIGDENFHLR